MNIPTLVELSTVPPGGVVSLNLTQWLMNCGNGTIVDLANGGIATGVDPKTAYYYFPGATLVIQ